MYVCMYVPSLTLSCDFWPLLFLNNAQLREGCHQYALKDKHTEHRARGIIYIETELVYNPVRAMIRTINPREDKLLEAEQKFKRKVQHNAAHHPIM